MKKIALLFMLAGIIFLSIGGYQYIKTKAAEKDALDVVHTMIESRDSAPSTIDPSSFTANMGEPVGLLQIPSIDAELAIVEGTDPDDLEKGVGHFKSSAYPKQDDQIVLSGHRDTVFRRLGDVKIGDTFTVQLESGDYEYEMVSSKIVDADDTTIIKSTAPDEELVITTCYPFSYIGDAPDRYIIYAKPIETN